MCHVPRPGQLPSYLQEPQRQAEVELPLLGQPAWDLRLPGQEALGAAPAVRLTHEEASRWVRSA